MMGKFCSGPAMRGPAMPGALSGIGPRIAILRAGIGPAGPINCGNIALCGGGPA